MRLRRGRWLRVLSQLPPRILLVEGDRATAETYRLALRMTGYAVDVARDGEEGLEHVGQGDMPDAGVIELGLPWAEPNRPRRDALDLLGAMRSGRVTNQVPVLALAGDMSGVYEAVVRGASHGLVNWRTSPQDLNRKVAELLDARAR